MALEQRLEVKLLQKLILTPQLQQAIRLLQMPQLELTQTLNNELIENPFLEETLDDGAADAESVGMADPESAAKLDDTEAPLESLANIGLDDYFDNRSYDGRDLGYFSPDVAQSQSFEQFVSNDEDLYDHLEWQLKFADAPREVKDLAESVIGNIDERGYLVASDEELMAQSGASLELVTQAVKLVQGFDPSGIGARTLQECLLLQLKQLDLLGTLVESIIRNNLPDLERHKYQNIAQQYGVSLDEVHAALKIIENLDPKPASGLAGGAPVYIKPDAYVIRDGDDFRIALNDESVPPLRINNYYRNILSQKNTLDKEEREYLTERLRSAVWLLKSLDHRNKTLYRVTESIVRFQREFFEKNVAFMKPLTLKDVAVDLEMHESTISRATANKYLSCSHGIFSFKFFFSSSLKSENGDSVSSTYVKDMVRKIIEEEDQRKPLSDQKISTLLKTHNIDVARRTVAKYRDELNIPAQSLRKRVD